MFNALCLILLVLSSGALCSRAAAESKHATHGGANATNSAQPSPNPAPSSTGATPPPSAAAIEANGNSEEIARGLFQAGKAAYEAGNYAEAVWFFDQAYARSPRAQLLFNIGQSADRLRQDDKALAAFHKYLEQVPDAPNRVEVQNRIAALERAAAERQAALDQAAASHAAPTPEQTAQAAPVAAPTNQLALTSTDTAPTEQPVTKKWWFWTGVGTVVVAGTAVALALALGGDAGHAPAFQGSAGTYRAP